MKFFAFFLALIALGFAGKCDFTCPSAYNAICGSDGKTYHNLCALRQANCKSVRPIIIAALGECSIPKVCDGVSCPVGQFCVARPKQCFTTPCPQYECVDEAVAVCDKVVCPNSRVCAFEPKQCFTTPCPQYTCLNRPTCPTFCTKIYTPVCGTDGKTYGNKCTLESAICSALPRQLAFDYEGECKRDCPDICPQVYQPVCGSDGNTYSNACTLSQASCRSDIPITQVSEGECPNPCAVVLCPPGKFCVPEPKECITTPCDQFKCVAPDCPDACPQVYQPVCGSDGNTYSNACTLSQASCRSDIPITQVSEGECPNPCAVVLCPPGKFCVPEPKQCITTPCDQFKCE